MSKKFSDDYEKKYGYKIESRSVKNMERILVKQQRNNADIHFKLKSDFFAFRINVEVSDITKKLENLENFFKDIGGLYFLRNSIVKNENENDFYSLKTILMDFFGLLMDFFCLNIFFIFFNIFLYFFVIVYLISFLFI